MNPLVLIVNRINQVLTIIATVILSLIGPYLPRLYQTPDSFPLSPRIATPSAQLTTPSSATISISKAIDTTKQSIITSTPVPWGTTEKIGDHLYRTYVGSDPAMGTPQETLTALNSYRKTHGVGELHSDDGLCKLAQTRAEQQEKLGTLDEHRGLIDYMNDQNHWEELNITAIGENASYGYVLSGVHLIEWIFDSDPEHRANQLNPNWNLACAATQGVTVDILFAKR